MEIQPQTWTHHHVHRLFHLSQLAAYCFIVAALVGGSLSVWQESRAETISSSGNVTITANVEAVNPGPSVPSGGGVVYPIPQGPVTPGAPFVTIAPWSDQPLPVQNGQPVFPTSYVKFQGSSNIVNALLFLDVTGQKELRSTAYLDSNGNWFWIAPAPLPNGQYTVTVTAKSQADAAIKASASLEFMVQVVAPGPQVPAQPAAPPTKKANAIDVAVRIPERFKTIRPGDEFIANLDFFQSAPPVTKTEVLVRYRIEDDKHHSLMDDTETLLVPGHLSLIKSFSTSAALAEGQYALIVSVDTGQVITAASDTFAVFGSPVILLTSPTKIDYTIAMQILLALALLFAFIAYFEYRKVAFLTRFIKDAEIEPSK
jgi:hypothetical protein